MSWPPMRIAPWVGSMKPEIIRRIVVLPQPEGPRKEKNSPGLIVTSTLSTARKVPKSIETLVEIDIFAHAGLTRLFLGRHASAHRHAQQQAAGPAAANPAARRPAHAALYLSAYSPRSLMNRRSAPATTTASQRVAGERRLVEVLTFGSARSIAPLATGLAEKPRRSAEPSGVATNLANSAPGRRSWRSSSARSPGSRRRRLPSGRCSRAAVALQVEAGRIPDQAERRSHWSGTPPGPRSRPSRTGRCSPWP